MTPAQKAAYRAQAQTLKPAVHVGRAGVTPDVVRELDTALRRAELVKVRFTEGRDIMKAHCEALAGAASAECVGGVGRVASFFRAQPETAEKSESAANSETTSKPSAPKSIWD